jgi:hypothetical protein
MDKRALSQRTIALIVFVFFLASFLQASDERHFRSAQRRIAGQDLSNSWNQPAERQINVVTAVSGPGSETTNCTPLRWPNRGTTSMTNNCPDAVRGRVGSRSLVEC